MMRVQVRARICIRIWCWLSIFLALKDSLSNTRSRMHEWKIQFQKFQHIEHEAKPTVPKKMNVSAKTDGLERETDKNLNSVEMNAFLSIFFSFFSLSRRNFSILLSRFPNSCFSSLFKKIWFFGSLYYKIYNFETSNPKKVFLGGKKVGFCPSTQYFHYFHIQVSQREAEYGLLNGKLYSVNEAYKVGLIDKIVANQEEAVSECKKEIRLQLQCVPMS